MLSVLFFGNRDCDLMKHSKRAMRVGVAAVANHELAAKSTNGWRTKEKKREMDKEGGRARSI